MVSKAFLAGIVFGPRHSYLKIKNLSAHVTGTDERIRRTRMGPSV